MIRLEEVNEENWRLPLKVAESQAAYVPAPAVILARAYAYRGSRSMAYVICSDEPPVGMVMYHDCAAMDAYIFSELFIDARYQGRGYGKAAVRCVLDMMRRDGRYRKVCLCYIEGNTAARALYQSFGFVETDRDGNEIIMEMAL